jgi:Ca2+-binding EF-hand superfamily protein
LKEFVTVSIHLKKIRSEDHFQKVFNYFDKNGSGYIEIEELKEELSPRGGQKAIDDIILDVDKDKVSNTTIFKVKLKVVTKTINFNKSIALRTIYFNK